MRMIFLLVFTVACGMEQGKAPRQITSKEMARSSSLNSTMCVHISACSQDCQIQSSQCYGACSNLSAQDSHSCREKCDDSENTCMNKMVTMEENVPQDHFDHPL